MTVTVSLIRSGCTAGGRQGLYVGRMDEPLDEAGRREIEVLSGKGEYRPSQLLFSSPLLRCRETAQLAHPHSPAILLGELAAFDYGRFTGRTYAEIVADKQFAHWAQADQLLACPGGEEPHEFHSRCVAGLRRIVDEMLGKRLDHAAVVTHRSVIRSVLQRYHVPRAFYQPWTVDWGRETAVEFDAEHLTLRIIKKN